MLVHVAGVIPGGVALAVFLSTRPDLFSKFSSLAALGYKTKVAVVLLIAFVIGNTITALLFALAYPASRKLGSLIAALDIDGDDPDLSAGWRDPVWRSLVRRQLRAASPPDTTYISEKFIELKQNEFEMMPAAQRANAEAELSTEKHKTDEDDERWRRWYNHYQNIVLLERSETLEYNLAIGLHANLMATALCILFSMPFVAELRRWWAIAFAACWLLTLFLTCLNWVPKLRGRFATFSEQQAYLERRRPPEIPKP